MSQSLLHHVWVVGIAIAVSIVGCAENDIVVTSASSDSSNVLAPLPQNDSVLVGTSRISQVRSKYGQDGYRSVNTTMSYVGQGKSHSAYMLKETVDHTLFFGNEGPFSRLIVEAYQTGNLAAPVWSIVDSADAGSYWSGWKLYRTIKHGCCGGADTQRIYDPEDGHLIVSSDSDIFIVERDESKLYIGVRSPNGMHSFPKLDWRQGRFAAFETTSSAGQRGVIVLHSPFVDSLELMYGVGAQLVNMSRPDSIATFRFEKENVMLYEPKSSDRMALRLYIGWNDSALYTIPLSRDGLNLASAVLPSHVTATLEPFTP